MIVSGIASIFISLSLKKEVFVERDYWNPRGRKENPVRRNAIIAGFSLLFFGGVLLIAKNNKNKASKPSGNLYSELEKLGQLKEKGLITEQEFQEQKRRLLDNT